MIVPQDIERRRGFNPRRGRPPKAAGGGILPAKGPGNGKALAVGPAQGARAAAVSPPPERGRVDPLVTACVLAALGVGSQDLARASRGRAPVALARQISMYLHHVELGQTLTEIAIRFGRDRTTVAHACRSVEDRRDDPAFEAFLAAIETTVRTARALLPRHGVSA